MKRFPFALFCLALAAPLPARAGMQLIPAGSLIQCTVSEPKLNSKTTAVGDPVLCQASYSELEGPSALPYGSYIVGRFEDYKDPGHFVGKGWMELVFDHILVEPDTVIPLHAKVVGVPGYNIDREGRILGKGHPVRDTVAWMIPILWPIDLINLPRRGPLPTLKNETRLTLKVMDDFGVPIGQPPDEDPSGLMRRRPSAYQPPPAQTAPPAAPEEAMQPPPEQPAQPAMQPVAAVQAPPPAYGYAAPASRPQYVSPYTGRWGQPHFVTMTRNGLVYRVYVPY